MQPKNSSMPCPECGYATSPENNLSRYCMNADCARLWTYRGVRTFAGTNVKARVWRVTRVPQIRTSGRRVHETEKADAP